MLFRSPMWWYGWIASGTLVGLAFAIIAMILPESLAKKLWSSTVWIVPLLAFAFLFNWELVWFIDGWNARWFQ